VQPLRRKIALTVIAVIAMGCAEESNPAVDVDAEKAAIQEIDQRLQAAAQAKDAAAFAALFAPDGELLFPNRPRSVGQQSIQETVAGDFTIPGFNVNWEQSDIMIAQSGDLAVSTGSYNFTISPPEGPVEDRGKYMTVWRKVDGEWRVAADMINTDIPLP
jgi:uncharacterized protein (TIGR02246 family)